MKSGKFNQDDYLNIKNTVINIIKSKFGLEEEDIEVNEDLKYLLSLVFTWKFGGEKYSLTCFGVQFNMTMAYLIKNFSEETRMILEIKDYGKGFELEKLGTLCENAREFEFTLKAREV